MIWLNFQKGNIFTTINQYLHSFSLKFQTTILLSLKKEINSHSIDPLAGAHTNHTDYLFIVLTCGLIQFQKKKKTHIKQTRTFIWVKCFVSKTKFYHKEKIKDISTYRYGLQQNTFSRVNNICLLRMQCALEHVCS